MTCLDAMIHDCYCVAKHDSACLNILLAVGVLKSSMNIIALKCSLYIYIYEL